MKDEKRTKEQLLKELMRHRDREARQKVKDVKRRARQRERRTEETLCRSLIGASPVFFVAISAKGETLLMNDLMLSALGYTKREVLGKDYMSTFVPKDDRVELAEIFAKLVKHNKPTLNENHVLSKDGRELLVQWHGRPVFDDEGNFDCFFGVGSDITERRRAEKELKQSEERHRIIAETAFDAIITIDEDSRIVFASQAVEKMFGYKPEEITGQPVTMLMPKRLRDEHVLGVKQRIETGRVIRQHAAELPGLHKDGREVPLEISYGEFAMDGNHYFTGVVRDITERKQAEREREYKNMLESFNKELETTISERTMSLLALKLADGVRTPVAVIGWTGRKIAKSHSCTEEMTEHLDSIIEEADKLESTLGDFHAMLKRRQPVYIYTDINAIVGGVLDVVEKEAANRQVALKREFTPEPLKINAQRDFLRIMAFTMLRNAIEFTPEGGTVTVSTMVEGDNAVLTFGDTGPGIPEEVLDKIFEISHASELYEFGMGLPLMKQIVAEHLGEIEVQSKPGEGTTFKLTFPLRWMKKA